MSEKDKNNLLMGLDSSNHPLMESGKYNRLVCNRLEMCKCFLPAGCSNKALYRSVGCNRKEWCNYFPREECSSTASSIVA